MNESSRKDIFPKPEKKYTSERLEIRFRDLSDAVEFFDLISRNREFLKPWMPWVPFTQRLEDTQEYFETVQKYWNQGTEFDFGIYLKSTNECIGSCGIHTIYWDRKTASLGYWICHQRIRNHYASEAVQLLEKIGQQLGIHRLMIRCDSLNFASQQVARKLNYQLEALEIDSLIQRQNFSHEMTFVKLLNQEIPGHFVENFPSGFKARFVTNEEFQSITKGIETVEAAGAQVLPLDHAPKKIQSNFEWTEKRFLIAFYQDEVAGWSLGNRMDPTTFRMTSSVVLEKFRGLKLYSRMLDLMIQDCRLRGYLKIRSSHYADNSKILCTKLRRGFVISGMNLNILTGQMIDLTLFLHLPSREIFHFRVGSQPPPSSISTAFSKGDGR